MMMSVICTAVFAGGAAARAQSQPAQSPAVTLTAPWTPESLKALKAWRLGDHTQARFAADEMTRNARDGRVRRDAAAITAMLLMDSDSRADCQEGRGRLDALAREEPGILGRPDCCLAYGLAQRTLFETTSAISQLLAAEQGYAAENAFDAQARTWIALADAWSVHNEWPAVIPTAPTPQPRSPEDARRYRRARIEELLGRAEKLVQQMGSGLDDPRGPRFIPEAPVSIELSLCEALLADPATRTEALQRLDKLTSGAATTRSWARAGLTLSRIREQSGDQAGASALLDRIAQARLGETSDQASARLTALREPRLEIIAERQQTAARPATLRVTAHHVERALLEVRRIDLAAHLTANQGRLAEGKLPTDGATQFAREIEFAAEPGQSAEISFEAPAGEYVVCVRGNGPDKTEISSKRLLIMSHLQAAGWMAGEAAAIWAKRDDGSAVSGAEVQFWLAGAYVPTKASLTDGVAIVKAPSDPRLAREKQWLALLRSTDGAALCLGTRAGPGELPLPVALIAERDVIRVGEELRILGVLLDDAPLADEERVEVEVRDATDALRFRRTAGVSAARTFSVNVPINEEMIGVMHVVARRGARMLDNTRGRLTFSVPSPEEADFDVLAGRAQTWETPDHPFIRGEFTGMYPWGTAVRDAVAQTRYRITELPTEDEPRESPRMPSSRMGKTDRTGRFSYLESLADYKIDGQRPVAVGAWSTFIGWDGRAREGFAETIFGQRPAHAWIDVEPRQPRAGQDVRLRLVWFDPLNKLTNMPTTVSITGPQSVEAPFAPAMEGLRSTAWRPLEPGDYEATVTLAVRGGAALNVRRRFVVLPATTSQPALPEARLQAAFENGSDGRRVQLHLTPAPDGPLLVLLNDLNPVCARVIEGRAGQLQAALSIPDGIWRGTASVWVWSGDAPQLIAQMPVLPDEKRRVALNVSFDHAAVAPGKTVEVQMGSARPVNSGLTVIARLISASDQGGVGWHAGQSPEITVAERGAEFSAFGAADDATQPRKGREVELQADVVRALFEGGSLWADSRALLNGRARFQVRMPDRPGAYRLLTSVWGAEGLLGTDVTELDAVAPLDVRLDAPVRMLVGDRTVAGCVLRNPAEEPVQVRVQASGSTDVSVDDLVLITGAKDVPSDGPGLVLEIPALATAIVRARIEGNSPGTGTVGMTVRCGVTEIQRSAEIQVAPAEVQSASAPLTTIKMRRTVYLLSPAPKAGARPTIGVLGETPGDWVRTPLAANERVATGTRLLVVEEFDLGDAPHALRWQQRLPLNARTDIHKTIIARAAGRQVSRGASEQVYAAEGQKGRLVHEYLIMPVRPGACRFSPPLVDLDGQRATVVFESGTPTLVVDDLAP